MTTARRRFSTSAAAVAAAVLLAGCGPTTELDLGLRSVSITVPRLVTPAVELIPPAPPPPLALPALPPILRFLPPAREPAPAVLPPPSTAPAPACPKAGPFAAPARPESLVVQAPPGPGSSTQVAAGSSSSPAGAASLAGNVTTTVVALPRSTSTAGQVVDSWRVERRAATSRSVELYQLVHPSVSPLATASGIYLVGMAWTDPLRGDLSFQPEGGGLFVLPSPVQLAASGSAQYAGSATDPDTLTTLSLIRNVTGRKRVDICGEVVDTFTVEMSGTLTSPGRQQQIAWTQQLATAYGAANVAETLTLSAPTTSFLWTRALRSTEVPPVPKSPS